MDQKLEQFVALLHRSSGARPLAPAERRPALKRIRRPSRKAAGQAEATARPLWRDIAYGGVAAAVIIVATWVAWPRPQPVLQATAPIARQAPTVITMLRLPAASPPAEPEPDEQSEMTAPDAGDAPDPVPPPPPQEVHTVALRPPPPLPPARLGQPAWLRFAVPAPATASHPEIAIVIDDLGLDKRRTERAIALPAPLTLSFLGYATDLPRLADAGRHAGHELLVHVPMEPLSHAEDMGPNGLAVGLDHDEVVRRLRWNLARFEGYVGINNHMGSRFTRDATSMMPVMEELKARGLLFLDSRTIGNSAGVELAQRLGVPHAARDVFLDNEVNAGAIAARLAEVEAVARRHGHAIAIGHPHDATLEQLQTWLADLKAKGFVLVPVSAIVRERWHADGGGATG
jgi:uncharacterized protein